jgi:DNA-binding transcriptional MerR regulator
MKTFKEISVEIGLPESTLRLYRDEFNDYIPAQGNGRRRRYGDDGVAVLRQIVTWKQEGWSALRIRDELARFRQPVARQRQRSVEERLDALALQLTALHQETLALRAEVAELRTQLRQSRGMTKRMTLEEALLVSEGELADER